MEVDPQPGHYGQEAPEEAPLAVAVAEVFHAFAYTSTSWAEPTTRDLTERGIRRRSRRGC